MGLSEILKEVLADKILGKEVQTPIALVKDLPELQAKFDEMKSEVNAEIDELDAIKKSIDSSKKSFWNWAESYLMEKGLIDSTEVSLNISSGALNLITREESDEEDSAGDESPSVTTH